MEVILKHEIPNIKKEIYPWGGLTKTETKFEYMAYWAIVKELKWKYIYQWFEVELQVGLLLI